MAIDPIQPDGSEDHRPSNTPGPPAPSAAAAFEKICVRCGVDCSAMSREKDAQGRYTCGPCANKARAAAPPPSAADAPAITAPPARAASPSGKPGPIRPSFVRIEPAKSDNEDDSLIELEGLDPRAMKDLLAAESTAKVATLQPAVTGETHPCGKCGRGLAPDVQVCSVCGFDNRKGYTGPRSSQKLKCSECGYDLRGLTSAKCPECGTLVPLRSAKAEMEDYNAREARRVARNAYLRPVILFAVGCVVLALVHAMRGDATMIVNDLIMFAIRVPVGVVVYFLCCLTFLGFDAPMRLTALRLLGVYAILHAVVAILGSIPIFYIKVGIPYFIHVILLMSELDLERVDAFIMATATSLAMFAVTIMILHFMGQL